MKRVVDNFSALRRVLESNQVVFDNKPNAILFRDSFITKVETLSALEQSLVRPYNSLVVQRAGLRTQMRAQLITVVDFGIMLAKTVGDSSLLATFTHYRRQVHSSSSAKMLQMATDALAVIAIHSEEAEKLGYDTEAAASLQKLTDDFRLSASNTGNLLDERRNLRQKQSQLIKECNSILHLELDRFVRFNAVTFPDFAENYFRLRRRKSHGSNNSGITSEISGTVTDNLSGLPLTGAKVRLIEQNWEITTESDGAFLFDDLKPGTYHISCQCDSYKAAEQAVINLGKDDAVVWNFNMEQV